MIYFSDFYLIEIIVQNIAKIQDDINDILFQRNISNSTKVNNIKQSFMNAPNY